MPRPAAIMSRSLQRAAKCSSQDQRAGSSRGLIANGELRANRLLMPLLTMPGSARGSTWLGQMRPQLPCELPLPTVAAVDQGDLPAGLAASNGRTTRR